jgi:transposase
VLTLPAGVRIYIALEPTDMRKSFDGLALAARQVMNRNVLDSPGDLFVFRGRRGDRLKILWWQGDGFGLYYRRLEKGFFQLPERPGSYVQITAAELAMILEGINLKRVERLPRYARPASAPATTP